MLYALDLIVGWKAILNSWLTGLLYRTQVDDDFVFLKDATEAYQLPVVSAHYVPGTLPPPSHPPIVIPPPSGQKWHLLLCSSTPIAYPFTLS